MESRSQIEEERRLCFVGMTRAKRRLRLSFAQYRTIAGAAERRAPSQFLAELPQDEIEYVDLTDANDRPSRRRPPAVDAGTFRVGQVVRHPGYGLGRLQWIRPNGMQTRVGVHFASVGDKVLILEFAKLEPAEFDEFEDELEEHAE
jgi:DNA helicase-2/ATP-dependent DNA helicase PcrA